MEFFHAVESVGEEGFESDVFGFGGLVGDAEEFFFGGAEEVGDVFVFFLGDFCDVDAGGDEAATDGGVSDELGVSLGVSGGGDVVGEFGEVGGAADGAEVFGLSEFSGDSEEVNRGVMLVEGSHGVEDFAMFFFVEIFVFDDFEAVGEGGVG